MNKEVERLNEVLFNTFIKLMEETSPEEAVGCLEALKVTYLNRAYERAKTQWVGY